MPKEKRLLPSDFSRKVKYDGLDDHPKNVARPNTPKFFHLPEDLEGDRFADREFLVFYFDNQDDYKLVRNFFETRKKAALSHPDLDTVKLVNLVNSVERGAQDAKKS